MTLTPCFPFALGCVMHSHNSDCQDGQSACQTGHLGINAKFSSLVDFQGFFSGSESPKNGHLSPVDVRLERFALQSVSRRILPRSRTAKCLRLHQANKPEVDLWRTLSGSVVYGGLQTCGSVWACPVCASKVTERRRLELRHAMAVHSEGGGSVYMVTLTNPHYAHSDLNALLKDQAKAMSYFNGHKAAHRLWSGIGAVGTVRVLEVTHGVNGWHPHFHILVFARSGLDLDDCRSAFFRLWLRCCELSSLPRPSFEHGVRFDGGDQAGRFLAEYAAKNGVDDSHWGLDHEMTKGHLKRSKAVSGRSPFDLLRSYLYQNDKPSGALFAHFAAAFKGKKQLVWSHGLKQLFSVDDLSDSDIAARVDDSAFLLGQIALEDWRLILRFDLRGHVLELARFGWEPIQNLIEYLRGLS